MERYDPRRDGGQGLPSKLRVGSFIPIFNGNCDKSYASCGNKIHWKRGGSRAHLVLSLAEHLEPLYVIFPYGENEACITDSGSDHANNEMSKR